MFCTLTHHDAGVPVCPYDRGHSCNRPRWGCGGNVDFEGSKSHLDAAALCQGWGVGEGHLEPREKTKYMDEWVNE